MPKPAVYPNGATGAPAILRARNRVLAALLAGVAMLGFITVISLAALLHYAETHHLLANL